MNWTETLKSEVEATYHATNGLLKLVDKDKLNWKPATGSNWMTTGQLLKHITEACGLCMRGFVTNEWPMPADAKPEDMLPTADKMPAVKSVSEAQKLLGMEVRVSATERKAGLLVYSSSLPPVSCKPAPNQ